MRSQVTSAPAATQEAVTQLAARCGGLLEAIPKPCLLLMSIKFFAGRLRGSDASEPIQSMCLALSS